MPPSSSAPQPLRVALIHRDEGRSLNRDAIGWWSYPVPEFEWDHYPVPESFRLKRSLFVEYDLIVYEDGKIHGTLERDWNIPVAYVIADSTLSEEHYKIRCQQAAENADILLVDFDDLERFKHLGLPAYRFSFASNDRFFYPRQKTVDVGFFFHHTPQRDRLANHLDQFCNQRGYRYACGTRIGPAYAAAIGSAKININLARNPQTRSNRIFDVFVSQSCLVCDPLPPVSDEPRQLNEHYLQFRSWRELDGLLDELLLNDTWRVFAVAAGELGLAQHTWAARARQLRAILGEGGLGIGDWGLEIDD